MRPEEAQACDLSGGPGNEASRGITLWWLRRVDQIERNHNSCVITFVIDSVCFLVASIIKIDITLMIFSKTKR